MKVSELFAEIGFKVDTKGLNEFSKVMNGIHTTIKGCVSGLREFSKAADSVAKAMEKIRFSALVDDKEFIKRQKAETARMRAENYDTRSRARYRNIRSALAGRMMDWREGRLEYARENLEFKKDSSESSSSASIFNRSILNFASGIYVFKEAANIIKKAAENMKESVQRSDFAYQTGMGTGRLKDLEQRMERSGLSLGRGDVRSFLTNLQQKMIDVRFGGDVSGFTMMGISPYGKNVYRLIEDISKSIKNVDNATAINRLSFLGVNSPDMIRLLRGELRGSAFGKYVSLTGEEDRENTEAWRSIKAFYASIKDFMARVAAILAPFVTPVMDALTFVVDLLTTILGFVSKASQGLAFILGYLVGVLEGIGEQIGKLAADIVNGITGWWEENMPSWLGGGTGGSTNMDAVNKAFINQLPSSIGETMASSYKFGNIDFHPSVIVSNVDEANRVMNNFATDLYKNPYENNSSFIMAPAGIR